MKKFRLVKIWIVEGETLADAIEKYDNENEASFLIEQIEVKP